MTYPRRRRLAAAACLTCLIGMSTAAQNRAADEQRREQWQKVDAILMELGVRPGATIADIGAGDGFFTARLAKAVGFGGHVYAVDISDKALERLRTRLEEDGIRNVTIVKSEPNDPKLPERSLDGALIVNAYHEMTEHQSILSAVRRALKPDGRFVIVEPVRQSRRGRPRADEERDHEIDPEFLLQDARATGFRVMALRDPFAVREGDAIYWLMTLEPGDCISTGTPQGVGDGRKPPEYLKRGDVMEADVEGIGVLRNPVR